MSVKVGINGLGRIGKGILRAWLDSGSEGFDVVMANDLMSPAEAVHMLRYDSVHGTMAQEISAGDQELIVDGRPIALSQQRHPSEIPWADKDVDIVLECTGRFTNRKDCEGHMGKTVKKVVVSAPAKGQDMTVLIGVNEGQYDPQNHHIVSNASCTTNCVAPLVQVLHEQFKIQNAFMTTIHSYTNDQKILDAYHKDPRRSRAGALSMIPTSTGAARMIGTIFPDLKGRIDGLAVRVPTPNVSLVDLVAVVEESTSAEQVNDAFRKAVAGPLGSVLAVCEEPLVSSDFNGNRYSSTLDALSTNVIDGHLVKVLSWYDNEVGFSHRMLELTQLVAKLL
jgi:glyceraldehyde 3-phosphate dehydrogenase